MAGYIKRDDVLAKKRILMGIHYGTEARTIVDVPAVLVSDIEDIPDEDVRPVVLCRDCEHSPDGYICDNPFHGGMTFPGDFCSDGKRRDMKEDNDG